MDMREKILLGAVIVASAASPAFAQSIVPAAGPSFSGSVTGATSTSVVLGTSSTTQSGDSTIAPYLNTVTTVQNQTLTTSATGTTTGTTTFAGLTVGYVITGSGTGSQNQTVSGSLTTQFAPGNPPSIVTSTSTTGAPVNVGSPTVSAVSVSGNTNTTNDQGYVYYGGNLSSSGTPTNGSVNVTENTIGMTTSGVTLSTYTGTATYDPATGTVSMSPLALSSAASITSAGLAVTNGTATTTVGATGISTGTLASTSLTTGAVSATSLNMNGGRITNVGTPTAATDAATKGYVDTQIAGVNTSINSLSSLVRANRKRADRGIATAVALSGGAFLPDKKFNLTANVGAYRGETAVAAQIGMLVNENLAFNAGVATSFNGNGGTALRGGLTFGF